MSGPRRGRAGRGADLRRPLRCRPLLRRPCPDWSLCSCQCRPRNSRAAWADLAEQSLVRCPVQLHCRFRSGRAARRRLGGHFRCRRSRHCRMSPTPSPLPAPPGALPACRTVISCGAACRMGLSGSADRMPMSGRQMPSTKATTSTPQPTDLSHGYFSQKFGPYMMYSSQKWERFVQFIRIFKELP